MQNSEFSAPGVLHFAFCILPSFLLPQRQPFHLLQRNAQDAPQREALRKTVRDAHAGAGELQEVERRLATRQHVHELAREVLAVVGVEVQGLEVIAEVHGAQRGRAAGELRQRDAERHRAEDPILLGDLAAPEVLLVVGELLEAHRRYGSSSRSARVFAVPSRSSIVWQLSAVRNGFPGWRALPSSRTRPGPKSRTA